VKTERVTVASLLFDPANVRKHGERNLDSIKASLARFGQQKPIVVDGDGIVRAGNGTLMAAKALGWDEIEIVRTNLRGSEATAYAIADNRTAELAEWDEAALAEQLAALQIDDEALAAATGFDASEIERMALPVDVVEDEVPEVPVEPITKPGDLWLLGEHRVMCGDSADTETVRRLIPDRMCEMIVTDPPYSSGGRQDGGKRNSTSIGTRTDDTIARDNLTTKGYVALICRVLACIKSETAFVFTDWRMWTWTFDALESSGYPVRNMLVWDKQQMGMGFPWRSQHELIAFAKQSGAEMMDGKLGNVLQVNRQPNELHPTQKPIELIATLISNTKGETVYDPFIGSGTTLIAAEQLGRKCYGMEISPAYCDVIVKRWETLTGKKATLAA
jgi:DNA modification methylase